MKELLEALLAHATWTRLLLINSLWRLHWNMFWVHSMVASICLMRHALTLVLEAICNRLLFEFSRHLILRTRCKQVVDKWSLLTNVKSTRCSSASRLPSMTSTLHCLDIISQVLNINISEVNIVNVGTFLFWRSGEKWRCTSEALARNGADVVIWKSTSLAGLFLSVWAVRSVLCSVKICRSLLLFVLPISHCHQLLLEKPVLSC